MHQLQAPTVCVTARTPLLEAPAARVELLHHLGAFPVWDRDAYCGDFQICLPYRGVFVWHVGGDEIVGDANQVIFVRGDEPYRMSSPLSSGYGEVVITPGDEVLAELTESHAQPLGRHPLFVRRARRTTPRLQAHLARLIQRAGDLDPLDAEETVLGLLRTALDEDTALRPMSAATARLLRRAKEFMNAELSNRILLADVARAAGASPTYLTHLFRRVEGASLHQYLTQLRLARALVELPHCDDLTSLALDVGFSSHSHFTAAFGRAFGCTPSRFRASAARS